MMEWIESEECLEACSLERMSVGVSSDALLESHFTKKLCSPQCQNNCPNIVDLYLNLAAGEGIYLPHLCEAHRTRSRRLISFEAKTNTFSAAPAPDGTPSTGDLKASIPSSAPGFAPIPGDLKASIPSSAPEFAPIPSSAPAFAPIAY
eukprot:Gb_38851 [translate_table: standard]